MEAHSASTKLYFFATHKIIEYKKAETMNLQVEWYLDLTLLK